MKRHVAIIIPGGIGTGRNNIGVPVMERLVKLLARDFQITVFSLFEVNKDYTPQGFDLVTVTAGNIFIKTAKLFSKFFQQHRSKRFEVIHGFWALPSGFFAVVIGKIFRIKSIVSVLGGDAIALPQIKYGQLRNGLSRRLVLFTLENADVVICLTNYLLNNLKNAGLKRPLSNIIPWGVDPDLFVPTVKAIKQPIQFLHIANLNQVKDQETLIRAFKIIHDHVPCILTIIGEGELERQVKGVVRELGLTDHITFKAVMPYENLPVYYQQSDILLHTSLSEGQSEVVTEAMSCGLVVCGTNVGLLYDLPECCIRVPVKDYQGLGNEVLKLLEDPERIDKIRAQGLTWSSMHPIQWTVSEIKIIYSS